MRAITYTDARNNLASELDRVNNDCDVTIITRQKGEPGVLMSLRGYESLMETAHLLRHPKNAISGCWSRRIDDEHRVVYKVVDDEVVDDEVILAQLRGHYD